MFIPESISLVQSKSIDGVYMGIQDLRIVLMDCFTWFGFLLQEF